MSTLFVNNLNTASGSTITVPTGKTLVGTDEGAFRVPGAVLQVVQGITTAASSFSVAAHNLSSAVVSATITPKSSSSKILMTGQVTGAADSLSHSFWIILQRDSTNIGQGDSVGNRRRCHSGIAQFLDNNAECLGHGTINFLDSPNTTSSITYSVKLAHNSGGAQNFLLNRTDNDGNNTDRPRATTTLTLMEIAQ